MPVCTLLVLGLVALRVSNRCENAGSIDTGKLFDRFYRADASRTSGDSFGLGLPIAKAIVEAHRGAIRCDSGGGVTRFTITIPVQQGK